MTFTENKRTENKKLLPSKHCPSLNLKSNLKVAYFISPPSNEGLANEELANEELVKNVGKVV